MTHYIQILLKWIPKEEKHLADTISKFYDTDNWGIDGENIHVIETVWKMHDRQVRQH